MAKKINLLLLVCALLLSCASRSHDGPPNVQFLGVLHPPLPAELEEVAGALVMAPGEEAEDALLAFSDIDRGGFRFLWLSRLVGRDQEGMPSWQVMDVVSLGALPEQQRLILADCQAAERTDVAALVEDSGEGAGIRVLRAWMVDHQSAKLIEMDAAQAECEEILWDIVFLLPPLWLRSWGRRKRGM